MAGQTGIQWTDWSWNPSVGCTRVSAGCDACYAFALHDQRHKAYLAGRFPDAPAQYHKPFSEVQLLPDRLTLPLRWQKPRRVFVDSMSDLWHKDVPDWFLASVFAVMAAAPQHTFQILTKRPQRMAKLVSDPDLLFADLPESVFMETFGAARKRPDVDVLGGTHLHNYRWPLPNVWLGVSVESQQYAWRIDWLAKTPAAIRFLSCEPLLGPLDLVPWLMPGDLPEIGDPLVDWVIVGGESGKDARPMHPDWPRSLRDQCVTADVPFFFKQWGEWVEVDGPRCRRINQDASRAGSWMEPDGTLIPRGEAHNRSFSVYGTSIVARLGEKAAGRELDGRTWDEFPTVQGAHRS